LAHELNQILARRGWRRYGVKTYQRNGRQPSRARLDSAGSTNLRFSLEIHAPMAPETLAMAK
jgi:hypothetical protein